MSIRTSIILVVTLLMVSGYVFFVQIGTPTDSEEEPPWFYSADMSDMARISITSQEEEITFYLADDQRWHIESEDGLPVGLDRWGGVTLLLSGPKSRRLIDDNPVDLAPYGLDAPNTRFEVELKDGRLIPVIIGLETPNSVGHYAQIEGYPHVYTVYSGWSDVLTRLITEPPIPPWYYDIETEDLARIEFWLDDRSVDLAKEDSVWSFSDENNTAINEDQINHILSSLEQPPSQSIVEYRISDLAKYGLDNPKLSIFLQTSTPGDRENMTITKQVLFHIGDLTDDGSGYYILTEREEIIRDLFSINAGWVNQLLEIANNPSYPTTIIETS